MNRSFLQEIRHLKTTKAEFEQRLMEVEDQAKHEKLTHLEEVYFCLNQWFQNFSNYFVWQSPTV